MVLLFYFFIVVIMFNSVDYFISFCVCDFLGLLFGLVLLVWISCYCFGCYDWCC